MTYQLNTVLIQPNHRSQIIFSLAHHRSGSLTVLFQQPQQPLFYQDILLNCNYKNIEFATFQEYLQTEAPHSTSIVLLDTPQTFQTAEAVFAKATQSKQAILLVLFKFNKKYLQILSKKVSLTSVPLSFSPNKFVGMNDKLRELVDKSYDLNRAAFYAYGSFLNSYRASLLKRIFRTDQINVEQLARSYGFTTPPRVKDGKFLKQKTQAKKQNPKVTIEDRTKTAPAKEAKSKMVLPEQKGRVQEKKKLIKKEKRSA